MPKLTLLLFARLVAIAGLATLAAPSMAVCLDGKGNSGYSLPIDEEIRTSFAVVTGEVIGSRDLQEDRSDPGGTTATIYSFRVNQAIKGMVEKTIEIRSINDSGRFPMSKGKMYGLFLKREKGILFVDICGNSGALEKEPGILEPVAISMRKEGLKNGEDYLLKWPSLDMSKDDGERVINVELLIHCGLVKSVRRIPHDWSVDAGSPSGGYARASAMSGHGSTALWRLEDLNGVFDLDVVDADCFSASATVTTERGTGEMQYSIGYDRFSFGR